LKSKLEQSLDEAEDSLEREKKAKGDVEKLKRKVEGDLKLTQETISDLDRVKAELNQAAQRKEKEAAAIAAKIEDEATLGSKYNKQVKELQARLEELDEELAIERANRAKAEKSRAILKKDIEDLGSRLEEAGANTATQVELTRRGRLSLPGSRESSRRSTLPMKAHWLPSGKSITTPCLNLESKLIT
jgi:chromosome segregation ATPase